MNVSLEQRPQRTDELPIRVVIVDDEPLARQLLVRLVEAEDGLTVVGQAADGITAQKMIDDVRPDLVFLDVMMPKINGVELMATFGSIDSAPYVVFVTAFETYATKAFDLNAIDYLVKPIERERFSQSVERTREAMSARHIRQLGCQIADFSGTPPSAAARVKIEQPPFVVVKLGDELIRILESDIYWLEAASQYARIHTKDQSFVVAESMNQYHSKLTSDVFIRVHRSATINTRKVARVLKKRNGVHELVLKNGIGVPLSRSRKKLVHEFLENAAISRRDI